MPRATARFLDHWKPNAGLFVESDLWPNLILGAAARGVRLALVAEITHGRMAHCAVLTTALAESALIPGVLNLVGKRGRVVVTAIAPAAQVSVDLSLQELTFWEKTIKGALYGSANPRYDIPKLLDLYKAGDLKLEELVTHRYPLSDVNQGYADMRAGKSLRGVLVMNGDEAR